MLIRFNVKNFLSFSTQEDGSAEEFSMIAGKVRSKNEHIYEDKNIKLLKFAAVYGANASGKSNLVKAMDFMKKTVIEGLPVEHTEKYCKVKPENKEKPSYFEIEIMLGKKYYAYGFEVILSQSKFISEWLVELTADNKEKVIFTRDIEKGEYQLGGPLKSTGLKDKMNVYAGDIRGDSTVLLLQVMNQNKANLYQEHSRADILRYIFLWIKSSLDINFPDTPISSYSYMIRENDIAEICRVISAFGTGITDFKKIELTDDEVAERMKRVSREIGKEFQKIVEEAKVIPTRKGLMFCVLGKNESDITLLEVEKGGGVEDIKAYTLQFAHGKNNILFELSEESDGTRRLLDLLEILLTAESKTYVIDELDRCLHPSLSYKFIETFMERAAKRNVQLIVTTHESRLMDFDLLRRDEIWFVEKNKVGESHMYSLEEYNERFDKKIDKAYLEGRYGGVPIFSTIFPVKED